MPPTPEKSTMALPRGMSRTKSFGETDTHTFVYLYEDPIETKTILMLSFLLCNESPFE